MAQTKEGALKIAAKKRGMTVDEYKSKLSEGFKWCVKGKHWVLQGEFSLDNSRFDKLKSDCRRCSYTLKRSISPGRMERAEKKKLGLKWCRGHKAWLPLNQIDKNGLCREHANQAYREYYKGNGNPAIRNRVSVRLRGVELVPIDGKKVLSDWFDGFCAYCRKHPATAFDHIIPVAKGGITEPGNMLPVCIYCNSSKNDTPLLDWAKSKGVVLDSRIIDVISLMQEDDERYGSQN